MQNEKKNSKPNSRPTSILMRLLQWLTNLELSGSPGGGQVVGNLKTIPIFESSLKREKEMKDQNVKKFEMKIKSQLLKGFALVLFLVAFTMGAMAQVGSLDKTGAQTVCVGSTESYGVVPTPGSTYSWTVTPLAGRTISGTTNIIDVLWSTPGTYEVSVIETNASNCAGEPTTVTVTVSPFPVPIATADTPCENGTLNLTGAPAAMALYSWIGPNGFNSTDQNPTIPNVTIAAAGTYTLTVTNSSGCTATSSVEVTINPLPAPTPTADVPCENGTLTLTGAPAGMTAYSWTGPNGFTSALQSPTIPNVTMAAAGTYTLTVTNSSGCTATSSVDVTINPLPAPTPTANVPCENGTLTLTGAPAGMTAYSWTGPNGFTSALQSPTIPNATLAAAGTYTLTVTNSSGCTATSSVDVTINPLPAPTPTADVPCENGTLTLTGAPAGMTAYSWTGPNGFTSALQSPTIPNVTMAAAGAYTLTVTNSSGCTATSSVDVTINALPAPTPTADVPCENGTLTLTGAPAGMTAYSWTGPNGFTSALQSPTIPNVTMAAAGTYILTVTNSSGCTATSSVDVTINPLPAPTPTANVPCENGTLTLTGAPAGMTAYSWTGPNGFTSALQSPTIPNVTMAAAGTYILTVTNSSGCTATSSVDVTINPLPAPTPTADVPCENGTLTLTGAPAGMTAYSWTGPNGFTSALQSPTIPNVTMAAAGTYTLTVTNSSGCTATSSVDVTINPLPIPVATANEPCVSEALVLTGKPDGMTSYSWTGPNGFTSTDQNPVILNVSAAAAGTYTLMVTNSNGCTASTTVVVKINPIPVTSPIWHN